MKTKLLLFFVVFNGLLNIAKAAVDYTAPVKQPTYQKIYLQRLATISVKEIEAITGKKLTFKERLGLKFIKWKMRHQLKGNENEVDAKAEKRAQNSLIFGIATWGFVLLGLVVPFIGLLSLPCAIIALITGGLSINKVKDKGKANAGIILGSVYLLLLLIGIVIILANPIVF